MTRLYVCEVFFKLVFMFSKIYEYKSISVPLNSGSDNNKMVG